MVSTTICVSVNRKATFLPSTPVLIYDNVKYCGSVEREQKRGDIGTLTSMRVCSDNQSNESAKRRGDSRAARIRKRQEPPHHILG